MSVQSIDLGVFLSKCLPYTVASSPTTESSSIKQDQLHPLILHCLTHNTLELSLSPFYRNDPTPLGELVR